jgi:hypothetical protein
MTFKIRKTIGLVIVCFLSVFYSHAASPLPGTDTLIAFETNPILPDGKPDKQWLEVPHRWRLAKFRVFNRFDIDQVIDERSSFPKNPDPGQPTVITVAFNGGSAQLRHDIAEVAKEWCAEAGVIFDFGFGKDPNGSTWSSADDEKAPVAQVRIGFLQNKGNWAFVGRQSEIRTKGNCSTMNLEGFDNNLPSNWRFLTLHEFGHVLGLLHELQHPEQKCDLHWSDDPGYQYRENRFGTAIPDTQNRRPGVFTVFGSRPNNWTRPETERNLGIITDPTGLRILPFDQGSAMLYPMEAWLFNSPDSACATQARDALSLRDIAAVQALYPRTPAALKAKEMKLDILQKEFDRLAPELIQ